jgi:hypothetical protein
MKPKQKSTIIILAVLVLAVIFFMTYMQKPMKYADRDELTKAATDLRVCSQDSDCSITYGMCTSITAINTKYKTIWENTPASEAEENKCAVMGAVACAYHSQGYDCSIDEYVAKCLNNVCEAKHEAELT